MLVHLLNRVLNTRNGSAIIALRSTPLFSVRVGDNILTYNIVETWCIERPIGGFVGEYSNLLSAFAAASRMKR